MNSTAKQQKNGLHWARLDNAAKIYPAARRRNWSSVFRQSVTLREDVDVPVLQAALDVTVKRFPVMAARLRRGVFWYYLQQIETAPAIRPERSYPMVLMDRKELRKCAFRVVVHHNRMAVEFFHSLTDGTGAMIFLKSLTAEYLEQKYGISVPAEQGVLNRREAPKPEELEDSFPKYAGAVAVSRKDTNAWQPTGESQSGDFRHLTCLRLPVRETRALARQHQVTVTVFLAAAMMQALANMQRETVPDIRRRKRIKLMIPVNLRNLFPSRTLRNFAMYTIPEIDPRLGEFTFDEICQVVRHKMGLEVTPKHMSRVIATNVNDEKNLFIRLIPLPLKSAVMRVIYDFVGEKKSCMSMSNLGVVTFPEVMKPYIQRVDFILGERVVPGYNCGVVAYEDTINVNFTRTVRDAELERHFFYVLRDMGLPVTVESNQTGRG